MTLVVIFTTAGNGTGAGAGARRWQENDREVMSFISELTSRLKRGPQGQSDGL